jgi:hypothetical protein
MRNIIKLTKIRTVVPSQKYVSKINLNVKELTQKVTFINDIMIYQFLLCNTVYVPMFAFYMIYK